MVKILCVSDTVVPQMENAAHLRRRYSDVDLLISCGDMPAYYLEYITSVLNVPLFYVRGNHDTNYPERPPGGEDLHKRTVRYKGLVFAGIEGSMKYNNNPIQYTNIEVSRMVLDMALPLGLRRIGNDHGLDVLVTHSPPKGIHDREDLPHRGFAGLLTFMEWYRPRFLVHGHVHTWDNRDVVVSQYKATTIMNINPVKLLEIDPL